MRDKLIAEDWEKDATKVRTRHEWLLGWGRGWDAAERHYQAAMPTAKKCPNHGTPYCPECAHCLRTTHADYCSVARAATKVETSHEMLMRETFEVEGGKLALYLNTVERLLGHSPAPAPQKEKRAVFLEIHYADGERFTGYGTQAEQKLYALTLAETEPQKENGFYALEDEFPEGG